MKGKVAVVTGSGAGIGRSIAEAFAQAGASVVIPDIDGEAAETTADYIKKNSSKALALEIDVTDPQQVDHLFDTTIEQFGRIDILINNAGTTHPVESILDLDLDYLDRIFELDYKGVYLCSRRAGREMIQQKDGLILNISSIAGITPLPLVMYGPMKSAVNMMTRILARQWAPFNVRVNAIAPGYVLTPLIEQMVESGQRDSSLLIERIPMHSMLEPNEIADAAIFLASAKARHITGIILPIEAGWLSDGGWSAYNIE